jgi:hypothetical protein
MLTLLYSTTAADVDVRLARFGNQPAKMFVGRFVRIGRNDSLEKLILYSAVLFVSYYFGSALPQEFVIGTPTGHVFVFGQEHAELFRFTGILAESCIHSGKQDLEAGIFYGGLRAKRGRR